MASTRRRIELSLLAIVFVWGANFSVTKAALAQVGALEFNAVRLTLSVMALFALVMYETKGSVKEAFAPLKGSHRWRIVLLGIWGHFVYQMFFILGLDMTTAGNAALLIAGTPIWTSLISRAFGLDTITKWAWLGIIIAFLGTATIVLTRNEVDFSARTFRGDLFMVMAAVAWGSFTALNKPLFEEVSPNKAAFLTALFGYPFIVAVAIPSATMASISQYSTYIWVALIFSGCLSAGISGAVWNYGIRELGPSYTSVFSNLVPLIALVIAIVFLGEYLKPAQIIGGSLILGGLYVMRKSRSSES